MRVLATRGFAALWMVLGLVAAVPAVEPRFDPVGEPGAVRDNVVSALALDARGLLWAGSAEGLLRFDGYAFRRYPLSAPDGSLLAEQFVRAMLADPRGWLWVAAGNVGLVRLDLASGHWSRWARDGASADETAPAANTVRALALEPDGTLWIGGSGGLDRLDVKTQRFTHHRGPDDGLPDARVQSLLVDHRGTLWIGSWRGLARKAADGPIEPLDLGLKDQLITLLAEARDGRIIVGTAQGKLRALDAQGQVLPFSAGTGEHGQGAWPVMTMTQPSAEELWFGDASGIERRRAGDGGLIERMPASGTGTAPRSDVRALLRDPSGTVWVGSFGGGLMRHVPPLPGLSMVREPIAGIAAGGLDVRSALQLSNGEVWLGMLAGGIERRDRELQPLGRIAPGASGLPPGRVNALGQTRDGSVWVAVDTQLLRFDAQGHWKETLRSGNAVPRRLHATDDGAMWIATLDGLMRWTPERPAMRAVATAGLVGGTGEVNAFANMPDGSLWAGGAAGLFRVARPGAAEPVAEWVEPHGLTGQTVLGMAVDAKGVLWVDTGTGLHRLVQTDGRQARFEAVAASDVGGAFGANLLLDARGRIWSQRNMFDPASGERRELGAADGADLGTGWFRAFAPLDDGRMLFGGARGLLVIDPARFSPWTYQPPLVVSELRVEGGERVLPADGQPLVLAPGERAFSLSFASLDYSQPGRNRYRYRLEGLDKRWVDTGALMRTAAYTNLSPGHYKLHLQGSNRDGAWSPRELVLGVDVRAAWWQSRWALALAVLLALGAVAAIVNMRTRLLLRHRRVLEARVRERTEALEAATAELNAKSVELEEASLTDPLTGLRNRRFLERQMPADVAMVVRHHEPAPGGQPIGDQDLLFFLIDFDHFKRINDERGHAAGDDVLKLMRSRLLQVFREADYLIRWGGEEFLVVARGLPRERAAELAERARHTVAAEPFVLADGTPLQCSCSVGFAAFPLCPALPRALDWRQVVDLADAALYAAKAADRNAWVGLLQARAQSEAELREDVRRDLADWAASGKLQLQTSTSGGLRA
ncbi:ligand-binding sensor domain-containing diguanylate cyclase [Roseateles saccharophilus]|uniref:diguanylate cyclase n=1 Tax=Roseateles saccharophilus TaxID=304 RepID=A0A4R3UKK2_ROSSA|nr:ligand-binding sensor domain-containing diguanylate cyclase [Roseateles saccharophilus]MDG0834201.1 GGDEF domain-containing protein [Roseateles saccharophilus]TCU89937.1 diguanylate cyclase (GGDEF)-like protein [Roseateles saccharophilus]